MKAALNHLLGHWACFCPKIHVAEVMYCYISFTKLFTLIYIISIVSLLVRYSLLPWFLVNLSLLCPSLLSNSLPGLYNPLFTHLFLHCLPPPSLFSICSLSPNASNNLSFFACTWIPTAQLLFPKCCVIFYLSVITTSHLNKYHSAVV